MNLSQLLVPSSPRGGLQIREMTVLSAEPERPEEPCGLSHTAALSSFAQGLGAGRLAVSYR